MFEYDWFYLHAFVDHRGDINPTQLVEHLNQMTKEGWELVIIFQKESLAIFKRQV